MEFNKQDLVNDVELFLKTYAQSYAKGASKRFTEAAKQTIVDVFYNAYSQKYYDRTDDLRNNSAYEYFKDNGTCLYGGVVIGDRDMSDYINNWHGNNSITPASSVVSWTWRSGYHGYLNGDPSQRIQTFPPLSALEMEVGNITQELENQASDIAKQQQYSVLQF